MSDRSDSDSFDRMMRLFADSISEDAGFAEKLFRAQGVDIEKSYKNNIAFVEKQLGKENLRQAADEREQEEEYISSKLAALREKFLALPDPVSALKQAFGKDESFSFQFRNLEEITSAGAAEMLSEQELLRILAAQESEESSSENAKE